MSTIYDNFNYDQPAAGTTSYQGPSYWGPSSTRTVPPSSIISSGHYIANTSSSSGIVYTYSTPVNFSNVVSLSFTDTYGPSTGSVSFAIYLDGTQVADHPASIGTTVPQLLFL